MKPSLSKLYLLASFFVGLLVGAIGMWSWMQRSQAMPLPLPRLAGESQPHAQIEAFVGALRRNDRSLALRLWQIEDRSPSREELIRRREQVIADLLNTGIAPEYLILDTQWWRTCCEPGVTCDSHSAGGARIQVQFLDQNGRPQIYVFDVFAREQPYWGEAAGYPPRIWIIRDIYPYGEMPLYWRQVYESQVRFLQP